jgi:hypothetical protein
MPMDGGTPEAMAKVINRGNATTATSIPALMSHKNAPTEYFFDAARIISGVHSEIILINCLFMKISILYDMLSTINIPS